MRVRKEAAMIQEVARAYSESTESDSDGARAGRRRTRTPECSNRRRVHPFDDDEKSLVKDFNQIGEGTIDGSHGLLVRIFGEARLLDGLIPDLIDGLFDGELFLSRSAAEAVEVERKFPDGYVFGRGPPTNRRRQAVPLLLRPTHRRRSAKPNVMECGMRGADGGTVRCSPGETPFVEADIEFTNFIICPFLSTMVNEGALPVKQNYTRDELQDLTLLAGLDEETAQAHTDGNFINNPTGIQDLWNMEGATNEHVTSTGINDCVTNITNCRGLFSNPPVDHPHEICEVWSARECVMPDRDRFVDLWDAVDRDGDGFWTAKELNCFGERAVEAGMMIDRHGF